MKSYPVKENPVGYEKIGGGDVFLGTISLGRVVVSSPKIVQNFPGPMRNYPVNLLRRTQSVQRLARSFGTNRQTSCYFIVRTSDYAPRGL